MENAVTAWHRTLEFSTDENINFGVRLELAKWYRSVSDFDSLVEHNRRIIEHVDTYYPAVDRHRVVPPLGQLVAVAQAGTPIPGGTIGPSAPKKMIGPLVIAMLELLEHIVRVRARGETAVPEDVSKMGDYLERVMMSGMKTEAGKAAELFKSGQIR